MQFIYELTRSTAKGRALRGGNEMISANDRLCPHVKAELTAYLRKLSTEIALKTYDLNKHIKFSKDHPCHMYIFIYPPTKRRMDTPNWYPTIKALIDGLTDAGVFEDDNDKIITSHTFLRGSVTDNKKYKIVIDVREGIDQSWQI